MFKTFVKVSFICWNLTFNEGQFQVNPNYEMFPSHIYIEMYWFLTVG